jgi:hypothetical protein
MSDVALKLDAQLDVVCKKIERIAIDTFPPSLSQPRLKFNFQQNEIEYEDYIETFMW